MFCRGLACERTLIESLYRNLVQGSPTAVLLRDLSQRSGCLEVWFRDLAKGSPMGT